LDCISKVPDIAKRAAEYGNSALAISDHGTISSQIEAFNECKKNGLKWIPACEFYHVENAAKAREEKNRKNHHLILLAMNEEGWTNIKKLTTKANEKFYYAPRIDYGDLEAHSNGLICLTACLKGIVTHNVAEENYNEAVRHAQKLKGLFGDRFYLEVQDGGLDIQIKVNEVMRRMGEKLEIPIVGCQDAHYINREDVESHEALWAIRTRDTFDKPVGGYNQKGKQWRIYYSTREYWLKDAHHMINEPLTTEHGDQRQSTLRQDELERTCEIADRIGHVEINKDMHLPTYKFIPDINLGGCAGIGPGGKTGCTHDRSFAYLKTLVTDGYKNIYQHSLSDAPDNYRERLEKELGDIEEAGLADYFLIVWDIYKWAIKNDIPKGAGRGSAAGSLVSYCLDITEIDPIEYGLIWERFYNVGRKGSLADIDMDFSKNRRGEVIEYIKERFGEDRVAQMVTFNTLAPRAALKDAAKALGKQGGMPFEDANEMTRHVSKKSKTIEDALEKSEKLREYAEKYPRLFRVAKKIQGCPKSSGTHAAGIVVSDRPFDEGFPLRWNTTDKKLVTEFDGETLDSLNYLKLDLLGIKTLDVLKDVEKEVNNGL
jgi:DNA polymerase-3 subunit alpha